MLNSWLFTSKTDLRATPQAFFDGLNEEFWFTLDPCSTDENAKCEKHFTIEDDWLKQSRDNEIVFCNPPYWKEIKKRVQKWYFARGGGCCYAFTCEDRHISISRLHLSQIWNKVCQRSLEILRLKEFSSVSFNGRYL